MEALIQNKITNQIFTCNISTKLYYDIFIVLFHKDIPDYLTNQIVDQFQLLIKH